MKLAAVAVLLALAAANRFVLTPKVEAGDAGARRRLGRSIAAEIALVLLIFALVAGWRFTPPPRSIVQEEQSEFIHLHAGNVMADLTLDAGPRRPLRRRDHDPRRKLSADDAERGDAGFLPAGERDRAAAPRGGEHRRQPLAYRRRDAAGAGRWRLRIDVLIDDFTKVSLEDDILIRP